MNTFDRAVVRLLKFSVTDAGILVYGISLLKTRNDVRSNSLGREEFEDP
jgi:hypothetical protein